MTLVSVQAAYRIYLEIIKYALQYKLSLSPML